MEELFPSEPPKEDEGEWKIIEEKLPSLGERMEEAMVVAGVELTQYSTLKKLRTACEFLKIGKTGSKAQCGKTEASSVSEQDEGTGRNLKRTRKWNSQESQKERKDQRNQQKKREGNTNLRICQKQTGVRVAKRQGQERTTLKFPRRRTKHRWFRWILSLLEQEMKRTQRTTKMH